MTLWHPCTGWGILVLLLRQPTDCGPRASSWRVHVPRSCPRAGPSPTQTARRAQRMHRDPQADGWDQHRGTALSANVVGDSHTGLERCSGSATPGFAHAPSLAALPLFSFRFLLFLSLSFFFSTYCNTLPVLDLLLICYRAYTVPIV
jgi:hypothetical protein